MKPAGTEPEHRESRNMRIAQALYMLPGCAWMADEQLRYIEFYSSPESLFGCTEQQLIGQPVWSWVQDASRAESLRTSLERAIRERQTHLHLTWETKTADGAPRWLDESLYLHFDSRKRPDCVVGLSTDITKRKLRELSLARMQQHARKMEAVGTLVGGIAHEFNNILAGIVGNAYLLKSDLKDQPKQLQRLERIESLSRRAASLIEQMLAFGRKRPAKLRRASLDALVRDYLALEEKRLPPDIRLDVSLDTDVTACVDPTQIRQVLASLLSNAVDAVEGRKDARITVRLQTCKVDDALRERHPKLAHVAKVAHLQIRDNGPGIPRKLLGRVFDPFFTTKSVGQGTGMGLSMAYGIVDSMGGVIELESEEGQGVTAHVWLPQSGKERPDMVRKDEGEALLGQGETLLLADDEELVREAASGVLQRLGYQVVAVADGEDALNVVREQGDAIDLVLLDLIMPNMGGIEAAKQIRAVKPDMPILFITGFDLNETLDKRLDMAQADVVTKPFDIGELSRAIRRLLADQTPESPSSLS